MRVDSCTFSSFKGYILESISISSAMKTEGEIYYLQAGGELSPIPNHDGTSISDPQSSELCKK